MEPQSQSSDKQRISNPMLILHGELKDKSLKKSALESLSTISLALGRKKTREQLIPYLGSIFVQETTQIQKLILKGLTQLLHPIYIGKSHHSRIILELIMDILCVYSNKEIREEAYVCLEKVFAFIDVRKAQNMLVQALIRLNSQEDDGNIRQLVLRMIPFVYAGADGDREKQLLEILNGFKTKATDKKLLSEMLTEFIKVMPPVPEGEIKEIIGLLIKTGDKGILSNLIEPVILLTKVTDEATTEGYLRQILEQGEPNVICTALKRYWELSSIFKPETLAVLVDKISNYDTQPQEVKNTILELLDSLPIQEENMIKLTEPPSSLQLKTTLSETLSRVHDLKGLLKLFHSSDSHFQIKLFPKLPPISHMHIEVVDKIMRSDSWRQKITVLQNIDIRTEKGQATDLLLPKLAEFLGDKIACVRVAIGESIKNIMIRHQIPISQVEDMLNKSLTSRNWFERQAAYKMILELVTKSQAHLEQKQRVQKIARLGQQQKVDNIRSIAECLVAAVSQE